MNKTKQDFGDEPVFNENDGTTEQRAYCIANTLKHWGSDIFASRHNEEHTIPMWLTNMGLKTHSHIISYGELAKLISEIANTANELQDPLTWAKPSEI